MKMRMQTFNVQSKNRQEVSLVYAGTKKKTTEQSSVHKGKAFTNFFQQ